MRTLRPTLWPLQFEKQAAYIATKDLEFESLQSAVSTGYALRTTVSHYFSL